MNAHAERASARHVSTPLERMSSLGSLISRLAFLPGTFACGAVPSKLLHFTLDVLIGLEV